MEYIVAAIHRAAHEVTSHMTNELQRNAKKAGWDHEVAKKITVHYDGADFKAHVPESHAEKAFVHEYGDESHTPTAVIRRYSDGSKKTEEKLIGIAEKHLKGLL